MIDFHNLREAQRENEALRGKLALEELKRHIRQVGASLKTGPGSRQHSY